MAIRKERLALFVKYIFALSLVVLLTTALVHTTNGEPAYLRLVRRRLNVKTIQSDNDKKHGISLEELLKVIKAFDKVNKQNLTGVVVKALLNSGKTTSVSESLEAVGLELEYPKVAAKNLQHSSVNVAKRESLIPYTGSKLKCDAFAGAPPTCKNSSKLFSEKEISQHKKYFLFQPSGGWNNQRLILSRALRMCKIFNRVCIFPMYASHSSFFSAYNKLGLKDLLRMDRILDFPHLSKYYDRYLVSNMPFLDLKRSLEGKFPNITSDWYIIEQTRAERRENPILEEHILHLAYIERPVMYFAGPTMWQAFSSIPKSFEEEVIFYIRYAPFFRAIAQDCVDLVLQGRKYFAIHLRFEDVSKRFYKRKDPIDLASYFSEKLESLKSRSPVLQNVDALFIAAMPGSNISALGPLLDQYQVYTSSNFAPKIWSAIDSLFRLPDQKKLRNDILAIIDQLICIRSNGFVGTAKSTLTQYVQRIRRNPASLRRYLLEV